MDSILDYETVGYDKEKRALVIIDQTKLPNEIEFISLRAAEDIWDAIYELKVRGAPAIGVAAAIGLAVLAGQIETNDKVVFLEEVERQKDYLVSSRPTAVNLSWALNRMEQVCVASQNLPVAEIKQKLRAEAIAMRISVCVRLSVSTG